MELNYQERVWRKLFLTKYICVGLILTQRICKRRSFARHTYKGLISCMQKCGKLFFCVPISKRLSLGQRNLHRPILVKLIYMLPIFGKQT